MEFLDCRGCAQPLSPPVFQCSLGHPHFLCSSCCGKLPESKCKTCSGVDFGRCPAMEDTVNRILLPCKYGCGKNVTYYSKEGHEKVCKEGTCFCPEPGCGFRGKTTALFDHFTTHHKWPADEFVCESAPIHVPAVPGIRALRARRDDGLLFLLKVASLESFALKVSIVSVQPNTEEPVYACWLVFKWGSGNSQVVRLDKMTNSSLSDGLPEDCFFLLPIVLGGDTPLLQVTFSTPTKKVDDDDKMEEDDDEEDDYSDTYYDDGNDDGSTEDECEDGSTNDECADGSTDDECEDDEAGDQSD